MRGQRAASNLKDLFLSGKVDDLIGKLQGAEGSAKQMADLRMDNLLGDWEKLTGAVEGVKIKLFNLESGPLRNLVKGWEDWITANEALIVTGVNNFIVEMRQELPRLAGEVKKVGELVVGFTGFVRDNAALIVTGTKLFVVYAGATLAVSAAVKTAQAAMLLWRGAVIATTYMTTAGTIGNNVYTASLATMRVAAISAGHGLGVMRTALNATALAGSINGVTGLLGKAGLLGAALGVGYAIGTWLDQTFGFSTMITDMVAKLTGLEEKLGVRKTTRKEAFKDYIPNAPTRPGHVTSPTLFDMSADSEAQAAAVSPQVVSSNAREIASALAVELEHRQTVDVNVTASGGAQAEVKKETAKGGRSRLKMPASGSPR
jgi:hypothetical protein